MTGSHRCLKLVNGGIEAMSMQHIGKDETTKASADNRNALFQENVSFLSSGQNLPPVKACARSSGRTCDQARELLVYAKLTRGRLARHVVQGEDATLVAASAKTSSS